MKKKKSIKREIIEWAIFLGIIGFLFGTGLHTPVFGFIQGLILNRPIICRKLIGRVLSVYLNFLVFRYQHELRFSGNRICRTAKQKPGCRRWSNPQKLSTGYSILCRDMYQSVFHICFLFGSLRLKLSTY